MLDYTEPKDADIVVRLQSFSYEYSCPAGCEHTAYPPICGEAAMEIERLRRALNEAYKKLGPSATVNLNG